MAALEMPQRLERLKSLLIDDLLACEFKMSLFAGALLTYRQDFCLRPFPQSFIGEDGTRDTERLKHVFEGIPALSTVARNTAKLSEDELDVLDVVLGDQIFKAMTCEKHVIANIKRQVGGFSFDVTPSNVFEVHYTKRNPSQIRFDEMAKVHGVKYGFHGSRFDNFYSIVNNGLQLHLTKNALFGDGIYLSEDLAVTMPYVVNGQNWKYSAFGDSVGCIAVCEIIDHPDVKCQTRSTADTMSRRSRAHAQGSQAGAVPERYFVVTNSELVRIKYVLFFGSKKPQQSARRRQWLVRRYPVASLLVLYACFLVLMGLWRTKQFQMFFRKYFVDQYDGFT